MKQRGIGMTSARTRTRLVERLREQGIGNGAVLDRIRNVPRHLFVDEALASRAYEDIALPIGHGQTISQPYVVARMTEAMLAGRTPPLERVLEIGTGSGYQTAILSGLARTVFSIERLTPLLSRARVLLAELRCHNVRLRHGDGWQGWRAHAPFDGILVTAAPQQVPPVLIDQLGADGRLVIPVGPMGRQDLVCITRRGASVEREVLDLVSFVPLVEGKA